MVLFNHLIAVGKALAQNLAALDLRLQYLLPEGRRGNPAHCEVSLYAKGDWRVHLLPSDHPRIDAKREFEPDFRHFNYTNVTLRNITLSCHIWNHFICPITSKQKWTAEMSQTSCTFWETLIQSICQLWFSCHINRGECCKLQHWKNLKLAWLLKRLTNVKVQCGELYVKLRNTVWSLFDVASPAQCKYWGDTNWVTTNK